MKFHPQPAASRRARQPSLILFSLDGISCPMKRLAIITAAFVAVAVLFIGSYTHARARSDALVAKIPQPWERIGSRFCVIRSITGHYGPSWEFHYDPKNSFPVGPLTLQMSLLGRPIATNPPAALAALKTLP
jgi:hypothetical protein